MPFFLQHFYQKSVALVALRCSTVAHLQHLFLEMCYTPKPLVSLSLQYSCSTVALLLLKLLMFYKTIMMYLKKVKSRSISEHKQQKRQLIYFYCTSATSATNPIFLAEIIHIQDANKGTYLYDIACLYIPIIYGTLHPPPPLHPRCENITSRL